MEIKQLTKGERVPVDISEWSEVEAYARPLNGLEQLVFNDYFLDFQDRAKSIDDRFEAGFSAALMLLTDSEGTPLLTDDDRAAVKGASATPLLRVFTAGLRGYDTAKKN
ncbi:hypothetical protein IJ103_00100 [Candidatus Saccharibacteria bacterium]|nr:hypothetical protein [Candidatus Saccharibacteria bacterium]